MANPYRQFPQRSFWKPAVAERHVADMTDMWDPLPLRRSDRVATAGSCFAQHLGRNLQQRGANYLDMEPAPPVFDDPAAARRFGYGVFSCRYGNIYTTRQLLQLTQEALGLRQPAEVVWEKGGRYFDALRPGIDPVGEASPDDVLAARAEHLRAVRRMLETVDLMVFTLGLTEGWESCTDGTMFPTAPETIAGTYDPERYRFRNLRHAEIMADLESFWQLLREVNPGARLLLTVSPVPLVATATGQHVLPATTYSKSVLRGVAGDMATDHADIHYFPSYEIIIGHPSKGFFFEPDLRNVNEFGVDLVMRQFFSGPLATEFADRTTAAATEEFEVICDESRILDS